MTDTQKMVIFVAICFGMIALCQVIQTVLAFF